MKPLLAYAALVGLPLAGLAAVLRAGSGLQAPPSISGEWRIELPTASAEPPRFTISQSGTHVQLEMFGREYRGALRGGALVARSGARVAGRDACWDADDVRLRARVGGGAVPRRLEFAVEVPRVAGCGRGFVAVRAEPPRGGRR
ncbi:MAG TPA: hypothetical protein VF092_04805 [Longimicrobium sp.]